MATGNKNVPAKQQELREETIQKLIDQQAKETEVRRMEIDLRAQELKYNSAHAEKILGAQERDRNAEREFEIRKEHAKLMFSGACFLIVGAIIVVGLFMDKDAVVADIIKISSGLVAGAIGGYGYARKTYGGGKITE